MHERLLLERARSAYRLSRWKGRLDDRAGRLLARGYSPVTVGNYLCQWVDFIGEHEMEGVVPLSRTAAVACTLPMKDPRPPPTKAIRSFRLRLPLVDMTALLASCVTSRVFF
jgi:hypothetical protein